MRVTGWPPRVGEAQLGWVIPVVVSFRGSRRGGAKWRRRRYALSEAQNHRCAYCTCVMVYELDRPDSVTIDHVASMARGGTDAMDNLVAACWACNNRRGDRDAYHYFAVVQARMGAR